MWCHHTCRGALAVFLFTPRGNQKAFWPFFTVSGLRNCFSLSAPSSSSFFPKTLLSPMIDTLAKKNAHVDFVFKVQSRLSAFILLLIAPRTDRARQGFAGLNYLPEMDGASHPGEQAPPAFLPDG